MTENGASTEKRIAGRRTKLLHRVFRTRILFRDLIDEASHTLYLKELSETLPQRLALGLDLASLALFLKHDSGYVLQYQVGRLKASGIVFSERSSTVAHLRRSRRHVLFNTHAPDPWLLLAPATEVASLEAVQAQILLPLRVYPGAPLYLRARLPDKAAPDFRGWLRHPGDPGPMSFPR